jgi:hypothetical protein
LDTGRAGLACICRGELERVSVDTHTKATISRRDKIKRLKRINDEVALDVTREINEEMIMDINLRDVVR